MLLLLTTLVSLVCGQSSIEYSVEEEVDPVRTLGNLIADSHLSSIPPSSLQSATFSIVAPPSGNHHSFFDTSASGDFLLVQRIDRDVICPRRDVCALELDVQVIADEFYLIKVTINVDDVNDETPRFEQATFTFTLSEATTVGTTLTLPAATDLDSPANGVVNYSYDSLNTGFFDFETIRTGSDVSATLRVKRALDRETDDTFAFTLYAVDSAQPVAHSSRARVVINVGDINDNAPTFATTQYDVTVDENQRYSSAIVTVEATDLDEGVNARVVYELAEVTPPEVAGFFRINASSGELFLDEPLDFESIQTIQVLINARNTDVNSPSSQTRVNITVRDVNDNAPVIHVVSDGDVSISEATGAGVFVVHVQVSDADSAGRSGEFECSLNSANFELVRLVRSDYIINTKTDFDRETTDRFTLTIVCVDKGTPQLVSRLDVPIRIDDVNDNAPEFEVDTYVVKVEENLPLDNVIVQVRANDVDAGENATVLYFLEDVEVTSSAAASVTSAGELVRVDRVTGAVTPLQLLDYERFTALRFRVVASDAGNPPLSSRCDVIIQLTDADDNAPLFASARYVIDVRENNEIGASVARISASDRDSDPHDVIEYSLSSTTHAHLLSIDAESGEIFAQTSFDRETMSNFSVQVVATGPAPLRLTSTTLLTVNIEDANDNSPHFIFPAPHNDTVLVPAHVQAHDVITQVRASDDDIGDNARLAFTLASVIGAENSSLYIDEEGAIRSDRDLITTEPHVTTVYVTVSDHGLPQLSSNATLQLVFNDTSTSDVTKSDFGVGDASRNASIVIVIGVLSGVIVVALLIAIFCLVFCKRSDVILRKTTSLPLRGCAGDCIDILRSNDDDDVTRKNGDGVSNAAFDNHATTEAVSYQVHLFPPTILL